MSGPSASKLLVVGIAAALVFAPEAAIAAPKYKNCYMDTRFRPPMRVCDDPTPYKKPNGLEPTHLTGGGRALRHRPTTDVPEHGRIAAKPIRVVDLLVSRTNTDLR